MTKITVACLQLEALGLARAEEALERALALIDAAGQHRPDLMLLPECTYPAYYLESLESYARAHVRPQDEVLRLFGDKARTYHAYVVAGIAQPTAAGRLLNSAYLFDPEGRVAGVYSKSFLWHFDQVWFDPGREYRTYDLPFGKTGIFVCADGRMPEIARMLGVGGSQLMVDSTAWVTTGGDRATLNNAQFEYMMPARAIENGTWIAVANKVGLEAESVLYCGRSCVVSPRGQYAAQASTDREEYLLAEVDLAASSGLPVERKPELYAVLGQPTDELPITRRLREPALATTTRVGALQLRVYDDLETYLARVSALTETLVRQGALLVLLPGLPANAENLAPYQAECAFKPLRELSSRLECGLVAPLTAQAANGRRTRTAYVIANGSVAGTYAQVHLPADTGEWEAGTELPVFETPYGRLGIMLDEEGLLPEVARSLMLQGAELVLWPARSLAYPLRTIARTRADENKVFVALATPLETGAAPQTALVNPMGAIMSAALPDVEQAIAGQVQWLLTRYKEMAPGTDVVLNRLPDAYRPLAAPR